MLTKLYSVNLKGSDNLGDLDVNKRVILKRILKKYWLVLVNTVMNFRFYKRQGISLPD
jgi:hypothetical protein